ncbi:MAG: GGDEF-domain containing protein [Piscirickettsiaceae bacterium]|nr:MAG: GGDEF-domain containing protein [Piscirickettsiaceae bacterium]PCI67757.1 MAG: GGDEF-domain containing protein [Piscirickettsiaceae bacterium]
MQSVSRTPHILALNFNDDEQQLISNCLTKAPAPKIHFSTFDNAFNQDKRLDTVDLVLINVNEGNLKAFKHVSIIKSELSRLPKIIFSIDASTIDINAFGGKVIDVRSINPIRLTSLSIKRELNFQHHRSLFHQSRQKARNEHARFDAFLKNTEDGVALIHDNQYWSVNDAYKRIFNIPVEQDMTNKTVSEFNMSSSTKNKPNKNEALNTSLEGLPNNKTISVLIQKRGGESFVTTLYKTPCLVDGRICTQILIHNPNAWSNIDKGFTDLRSFDHETGVHNKKFIVEHINTQLVEKDTHGCLAMLLIDDFRQIRNQYTLEQTDNIIQSLVSIIKESCAKDDVLAKYGDAVFALYSNELDRSDFLLHCQKIISLVNNTIFGGESQYQKISLSIGVSFIDNKLSSAEQLIAQADKACDKAANNSDEKIHVYDDSISTPLNVLIEEKKSVNLIQSALEEDRLHTLFQPIVDLSEKATENYAVLLRIMDEEKNHVPPDNFILTAERTGLISQLDEWVLRSTIQQIKHASRLGIKRKFFITLSINTYRHSQFIETLMADVKFYGIDPTLLVFQINFSDIHDDPKTLMKFITIIKNDCGCQLAFDQVGFSEITDSMLKKYPVDYIKIDGSFTQSLLKDPASKKVIQDIVNVTKRNHVKTIAKSVENANALAMLWNIGIDAVQGYFLQRPNDEMQFDFSLND